MKAPLKPSDENERLSSLEEMRVLDSESEGFYDEIVQMASELLKTPIALVSLIDSERQWFKAKTGLDACETSREVSFCGHAILGDEVFVVEDAREDERFHDNPLVTGGPRVIFYAGAPIKNEHGHRIGTLCVIDHSPRSFSSEEEKTLRFFARQVASQLNQRSKFLGLKRFSHMMEEIHWLNSRPFSPEELFKEYLKKGLEVLELDYGIISRVEDDQYYVKEVVSPDGAISSNDTFALEDTYCHDVINDKKTIIFNHVGSIFKMCEHPVYVNMKLESFIGTPIIVNNKVYGTLNFSSKSIRKYNFMEEEIKFIEILAQIIAKKIEIKSAEEENIKALARLEKEREKNKLIGEIIDNSPAFISITDAQSGEAIYHNKPFHEVAIPTSESESEAFLEANKNGVWRGESAILDANKKEIPVLKTIVAQKDKNGAPKYISSIGQDISEMKVLQDQLEEGQQRLDLATSAAEIGVWDWSLEDNLFYFNESIKNMYGLETKGLCADFDLWFKHVHPDDVADLRKDFLETMSGNAPQLSTSFRIIRTDGETRFIKAEARVMLDEEGKAFRIIGANWDITKTKKHELELEESLAKFEVLTQLAPVGIFLTDVNGQTTYVNDAWLKLSGLTKKAAMGMKALEAIHPDDREIVEQRWAKSLESHEFFEMGFRFVKGEDKQIVHVHATARPIFGKNNEFLGYIGVNVDVTTRKAYEEGLVQAKEQALKNSRAKSAFLANMSHEIRTPLNSIVGLTDLMAESGLEGEHAKYIQTINNSSEILLNLVNDILDFSKIEAGELKLNPKEFALKKEIEKTLDLFQWQLEEKRLTLEFKVEKELSSSFIGDIHRVRQILVNLIGNALKFTFEGGVLIEVCANPNKGPGNILFKVKDTGIGIDKKKLKMIFQAFSQEEVSTTRRFGGTGLGLAITKKLVELMGGEIWAESEKDKGSSFFFTLNLQAASLGKSISTEGADRENGHAFIKRSEGPIKVLLVDDAPNNRNLVKAFLKGPDFIVEEAENGQLGLELLKSNKYDLVLMDLQMPVMDGFSATKSWRKIEKSQGLSPVPIIALTAYALEEEKEKSFKAGCNHHLSKPIKKQALLNAIEEQIEKDDQVA